jgi:uncharacterized membrane protein
MANKTQAKAAVDAAGTAIKTDIDNILPATPNITTGEVLFSPTKWVIIMDAAHVSATADSWLSTIVTNLTAASRTSTVLRRGRRGEDPQGQEIVIQTLLAVYKIINAA